jgi:hypothetical protein
MPLPCLFAMPEGYSLQGLLLGRRNHAFKNMGSRDVWH